MNKVLYLTLQIYYLIDYLRNIDESKLKCQQTSIFIGQFHKNYNPKIVNSITRKCKDVEAGAARAWARSTPSQ